jgi:hypothetical protein
MPLQNTIAVKPANIIDDKFIPLTDQDSFGILFKKWFKKNATPEDFWGTLGRQDNGSISGAWTGQIVCSKQGNNSFTTRGLQIREEAKKLAELYSDQNPPDLSTVYEKFIALKDLRFTINDPRARMMRLTVTLKKDEHALMFLQHTDVKDTTSQGGVFQYVLPEKQEDPAQARFLTYFFELPQASADGQFQTVIKVLTFKSNLSLASSDADVQKKLEANDTKYAIQLFRPATNSFEQLNDATILSEIKRDKKTLLLLHGTFSSTEGSYGFLYQSKDVPADTDCGWLKNVILSKKYEQVIGFDHPTVKDSPQKNAATLFSMLAPGGSFTQPVDIITTSRGGLVGKCVINTAQNIMKIERAATVACANGVQWMTTGESVGKIMGLLRMTSVNPLAKSFWLMAQLGVKFFLSQDGLNAMRKDSALLTPILEGKPFNKDMRYMPLCGSYLFNGAHPAGWRYFDLLLDVMMKNKNHDWVVETDFQVLMPDGYIAYQQPASFFRGKAMDTTHTRYFFDPMNKLAKKRIAYYLHDTDDVKAVKQLPADF